VSIDHIHSIVSREMKYLKSTGLCKAAGKFSRQSHVTVVYVSTNCIKLYCIKHESLKSKCTLYSEVILYVRG